MSLEKLHFRQIGILSVVLMLALCGNGCCVGIVTNVQNKTGKEISLTVINAGQIPTLPVTIPAGSSRICSGVMVDGSWIVSDGKSKFVFNDVSPIGSMRGRSRTESRFTSMFPCNRVTQHVKLETNMVIYAVGGAGQEISQPPGFPIHCTGTNANLEYDKMRYDQMQRVIDSSTNKLLGISLQDASGLLSLENVKWDEGYTSVPLGQLRVYHFQGFYLLLSLRVFPQGITPDSHGQFSVNNSELRSNGVWWVANFFPALHIDGINDPKMRMSNYWEQVHAGFQKRTEEMDKHKPQKSVANSAVDLEKQKWIAFAFASSRHNNDLSLLKKNLQSEQIHCMDGKSERYNVSFLVAPNDFARARISAAKIISKNSLTVNVEADVTGLGLEIWEKGKKVSTVYF